jgi:hypothetical protein
LETLDPDFPPYHQDKFLFFSTRQRRPLTVTGTGGAAPRAVQRHPGLVEIALLYLPARRSRVPGRFDDTAQSGLRPLDARGGDLGFEIKFPPCGKSISVHRGDVAGPDIGAKCRGSWVARRRKGLAPAAEWFKRGPQGRNVQEVALR